MASDGTVKISTELDESGAKSGLDKMESLVSKGMKGIKTLAATAGKAVLGVAGGLATLGGYGLKVGTDFESGMSNVAAISGATGEELDALTQKAQEMGAKTKFSATESAQAMEYMAMAGWKTEDMLGGIEGIMSLAAASGEDLATVSDIVTDSLTAFGLQASDSAHFADVLAKASSSSNTNVSMMGATFKYVAPLAGAMGYSVEDAAVAIGLMANAGIKGEQAGTSLRAVLQRLADPPKDAAAALDEMGISATNADGTMRPLSDVLKDLREKFGGLSESQKTTYASSIAGTEAMSGLLAIVNASDDDFQSLSDSINNASGAAKEMEEIKMDNLKGQVDILKSGVEGFGLLIYDEIQDPMKGAVKEGITAIDELSGALKDGGLSGAVEQAGETFADLSVAVANQAPKMTEAAVSFIVSFVKGVKDNGPKLKQAAKSLVQTFATEVTKLLPESVREPVKKAIEEIGASFDSGGFNSAIKYAGQLIKNLTDVTGKVAEKAFPPFIKVLDLAADNLDTLVPLTVAYYTAMKSYTLISKAASLIQKLTSAYKAASAVSAAYAAVMTAEGTAASASSTAHLLLASTMSVSEIAIGVLTGRVSLATAAQLAWNAALSANPLVLVATAVAAVVGGLALYCTAAGTAKEDTDSLAESNENLAGSYSGLADAAVEFQEGISQAGTLFDEFNNAIIVSGEKQQELADSMDSVQKQITDITGTYVDERRQLTDSEITELDRLFETMHEQAARELEYQQAYQQATEERAQLLVDTYEGSAEEYAAASQTIINTAQETKDNVVTKAEEQFNEELALLQLRLRNDESYTQEMYETEAKAAQDTYNAAVDAANKQCGDTLAILTDGYADRATALSEANDKIASLQSEELAENESYNSRKAELQQQLKDLQQAFTDEDCANKERIAQQLIDLEKEHEQNLEDIHTRMTESMDETAQEQAGTLLTMAGNVDVYGGKINKNTDNMVNKVIKTLEKLPPEAKQIMTDTMNGMLKGIEEKEEELYRKAEQVANNVINRLKRALKIHSPSRATREIFQYVMKGNILGLEDNEKTLYDKAQSIADNVVGKFAKMSIDPSEWVQKFQNAAADRSSGFRGSNADYEETESEIDTRQAYREQAGIIAEAVSEALEDKEFRVEDRTFARLVSEVK